MLSQKIPLPPTPLSSTAYRQRGSLATFFLESMRGRILKTCFIILAAGGSSRLGSPKQLLPYQGGTLVRRAAEIALETGAQVVVVVGSESEKVRESLVGLDLKTVENPDWQEGMASSIRVGISSLDPAIETTVIALCDQPKITACHLQALASAISEERPIAASSYDGIFGAPCAFHRAVFPKLLALQGDSGARELIRNAETAVIGVPFQEGNLDIDTQADYERLSAD
jgi:molybdenum cofactor cytidylyltransferase